LKILLLLTKFGRIRQKRKKMSEIERSVKKLIKDIQNGKDRYKELYNLTFPYLRLVALNYVFNKNDAKDVLSEVYIRVFKYINTAQTDKNCYAWLCRIVQRVAYEFNGKYEITLEINNIISENIFYEIEEDATERCDLYRVISALPSEDRLILYYRFWECMTFKEIGAIVNKKRNAVYKSTQRILKEIHKKLGSDGNF